MPVPMEYDDLPQKAVLWAATGYNDRYGGPVVADPVEIDVRWEWGAERFGRQSQQKSTPTAQVEPLEARVVVDRDVLAGSRMWLGELADWYGTGSDGDDTEVVEVVEVHKTPDIKGRHFRRVLGCKRFRDSPR